MKKLLSIVLISILFSQGNAQSIYFNKRIPITAYNDVCRGIVPLNKGYLVAGGHGDEFNLAYLYLSKLDSVGNLKWTKDFKEPGYAYYFGLSGALFKTWDNNYAICGGRVPMPYGYGILIKVDSSGNKIWEKEYQLSNWDNVFNCGITTKDSGFILTGKTFATGPHYRYLLLKTDSLGNLQWYQTYTDNHPQRSYQGTSVVQTADKGYCFGGRGGYWSTQYYYSIAEIYKTDSLGNLQWKKTFGNPNLNNNGGMLCLSADSCIVGTYCIGNTGLSLDPKQLHIIKLDLNGNTIWDKEIGNLYNYNWASWIQTLNNGGFIISGGHYLKDTLTKYVGWLFKLNEEGDSLWYREYSVINGIQDQNQLFQVTLTPDKGFAAAGSLYPNAGNQDIWVFKTDSMGCLVPNCDGVSITEFNPNTGAQMLIYPNPFKEAFAINYLIPAGNKQAVFQIYDINGRLVYQTGLTKEVRQLQVVSGTLVPGVYIAYLEVDGKNICSQKIIKIE